MPLSVSIKDLFSCVESSDVGGSDVGGSDVGRSDVGRSDTGEAVFSALIIF